MKTKYLQKI